MFESIAKRKSRNKCGMTERLQGDRRTYSVNNIPRMRSVLLFFDSSSACR